MTSGIVNRISCAFITIVLFFALSFSASAQEKNTDTQLKENKNKTIQSQDPYYQTANELTMNLSKKINLTADQQKEIHSALVDYQKNIAGLDPTLKTTERTAKVTDFDNTTQKKISGILNENQMTSYNDYKNEWWLDVTNRVNSASTKDMKKDYKQY